MCTIKTGEPLSASLVYETLPDGTVVGNGISNPQDGAFKMVLPYDKNYSIRATADHFFAISENLNLDSLVKEVIWRFIKICISCQLKLDRL